MPLRNDLLNPISPDQPSGENLRYAPIYDKIKEARREDDDAPQGEWKSARKLADWPLTVKLISETLATKTKDLQLVAWLAEAMTRREGVSGLREVLELASGYLENFWDTLYPEVEDGDAEFRAAPLVWIGERLELPIRQSGLTKGKLSWLQYQEARKVGTEADAAAGGYEKQEARQAAIAEGKLPLEEWDKDVDATPKQFFKDLEATYDATLASVDRLSQICDEKFGDVAPSFRPLKTVLEDVRQTVHILLVKKLEQEPDEPVAGAEPEAAVEEAPAEPEYAAPVAAPSAAAAAAPARAPSGKLTAEPQSWDDAVARVVSAARYMRAQDASNPAPYLMLRGLRWGELRASGSDIDQTKLGAPTSEIRQSLKKAALEGNWAEVLEAAEAAMGMECGRGWLDLQRFAGRACENLGYDALRTALVGELKALLADYPQLPENTMMDDTPTANAETLAWIREVIPPPGLAAETPAPEETAMQNVFRYAEPEPETGSAEPAPPDAYELAVQAARSGRTEEAIELLMREMIQEPSGRGRFQRKIQVAQLCLSTGNEAVALPILEDAAAEIERRKLEDWETREMVAQPLAMLYRCLAKSGDAAGARQKLYAEICRLDPLAAIHIAR